MSASPDRTAGDGGAVRPAVLANPHVSAAGTRRRSPTRRRAAGMDLLAAMMPENGGKGSLDYALRKMLKDDFPDILWQHNSDSRRAHAGFPDWCLLGPRRLMFRELKRQGHKPTPGQAEWLAALRRAGEDAGVWTPIDLLTGRIARELSVLASVRSTP